MLEQHTVKPEIRHFYEMPDAMKRGGKKKKAKKAKTATNINENKINVNVNVDKHKHDKDEFKAYKAITRTSRFATPNQAFANPPKTQNPSYFAVPNGVGLFENVRPASFQGTSAIHPQRIHMDVPIHSTPNPETIPNRQGIEPVSTHAQRAIPTSHATGGVMNSNPLMIREPKEEEEHAFSSSVRYFQPTGRNNIPPPHSAQHSAPQTEFFPLRGQQPETREEEMRRESQSDLPLQFSSRSGHHALHERQSLVLSSEKARHTRAGKAMSSEEASRTSSEEENSDVGDTETYHAPRLLGHKGPGVTFESVRHLKYGGHPVKGLSIIKDHCIF